jgi:hypothetical protein
MFAYFLIDQLFQEPHLASANRFDLNSIAGQRDFAQAVQDAGNTNPDSGIWVATLFVLIMALVNIRIITISVIPRIPKSIAQFRPDRGGGDEPDRVEAVENDESG